MENYIPLILSTLVSMLAIFGTIYQTYSNKKTKLNELYFSAQLAAYQNLCRSIANLGVSCEQVYMREFIEASHSAMLVSTQRVAEVINHFCAVYCDYIEAENRGEVPKELFSDFKDSKFMLMTLLQDEMMRFDSKYRKSDKYFKKHYNKKKKRNEK